VADERVQLAVLGHPIRKRALAPAMTDDQGPHARKFRALPAARLGPAPRLAPAAAKRARRVYADRRGQRVRHRTVIAVSFLDGAAVAAALFFGLSPHSTPTPAASAHHVAVAQAAPPAAPVTPLLAEAEEEARAREARHAAAKVGKTLNKQARAAKRAAAMLRRAQKLREREVRHADAQSRAAERQAVVEEPRREPQPKSKRQRQTRAPRTKHQPGSHAEAQAQRRLAREQAKEKHEQERAQREAARQQRREERLIIAAERQGLS